MLKITKKFIIFLTIFFLISTTLTFWIFKNIYIKYVLIFLREIFWILIIGYSFFSLKNEEKKNYLNILKFPLIFFIGLSFYSIFFSLLKWIDIKSILVGFKYDIYYLFIFLWFVSIWFHKKWNEKNFNTFFKKIFYFIVFWWLFFQTLKILFPNIFISIWFGHLWDFNPLLPPPIYYLTWPGWIIRFSGFFPWPNVMWFFLVLFSFWFTDKFFKKKYIIILTILMFFVIITMSRWAIVSYLLWAIFFLIYKTFTKDNKKTILNKKKLLKHWLTICMFIVVSITSIFFIQNLKWNSNKWHNLWLKQTLNEIQKNLIFWHWLWQSWPSVHYQITNKEDKIDFEKKPISLLESVHLQVLYDLWSFWYLLRLLTFFSMLYIIFKQKLFKDKEILFLTIWLVCLQIEWLVLHSFIDSNLNYIFFILFAYKIWKKLSEK